MIILNMPSQPDVDQTIRLDGGNYEVSYTWMARNWAWYFSMKTETGVVLAKNSKLVTNTPLIRHNISFAPSGNIFLIANVKNDDGAGARWNIGGLDQDFSLFYITGEEIAVFRT